MKRILPLLLLFCFSFADVPAAMMPLCRLIKSPPRRCLTIREPAKQKNRM